MEITENTSDGYHTFKELYEYRMLYNAALFNEWAAHNLYGVHKSRLHSGGEQIFDGRWFVVVVHLPTGQISNHYFEDAWDLFKIPEVEKAYPWDGHTPADVAKRLRGMIEQTEVRDSWRTAAKAPQSTRKGETNNEQQAS